MVEARAFAADPSSADTVAYSNAPAPVSRNAPALYVVLRDLLHHLHRVSHALTEGVREDQFRRVERSYGTFSRSFTLPNTVDAGKVSAEYKNGVLTVKLPFREEAKPRTINVEVAA